ncbi:hypothetical protein RHSIM_Rhsim13G0048700 [Rhododendron simsii]|uniref:Uncharacterized protein n=1 Tax=Rhododendron simsii TaxID=118357 RepID=A0A834G2H0_RHOSS|nr:hypothetical protein RHSIM_Rhsim13G0048700 [Rhododendron simsii]
MASLSTFVDGEYSVPAPIISAPEKSTDGGKEEMPNPDFVLWRRSDLLVCGWVDGSMSEEVLRMVVGLSSSSAEAKVLQSPDKTDAMPMATHSIDKVEEEIIAAVKLTVTVAANIQSSAKFVRLLDIQPSNVTIDVPIVEWLIDTGASDHNTADSRKLHNLRPFAEDICHARLISHEVKPENFLFQLPLTATAIKLGSLFITPEEVRNHFLGVGIPAETHQMEMLYFTDDRNGQWCMEIEFFQGPFLLRMEAFIDEHNLGVGDMIRFYKADQPLHSRHFLIGFVKRRGDPTQSGTAAVNDCKDRRGDSGGDGGGGAVIGGNGQGDDGGGSRSGGRKWWEFRFGGCCV